jgi:hypothetical protein
LIYTIKILSMTNKHTHHFAERVFSQQSHTAIVQILPTSGIVHADERTNSGGVAGMPRIIPLNVDSLDVSRDSARQPALSKQWSRPNTGGMQTDMSQSNGHPAPHNRQAVTLVQFQLKSHTASGTSALRPTAQANTQTAEAPAERGVRIDPDSAHSPQKLAERPLGGVRQDKDRNSCDRAASRQPAAVNKFTRSQATSRFSARSQKISADASKAQPVQVWVSPLVKAELSRIAASEGLSLSAAGAAFLTRGLQQNVDMQYGALINPVIEKAFARQMGTLVTRLTWLLVRIAFDAGQTRSLVTNILGRQPGVTQPMLKTILESSGRSAKANIMRRTPQISELIESVEQWMVEDEGQVTEKQYD